jgi:hypothetical protein
MTLTQRYLLVMFLGYIMIIILASYNLWDRPAVDVDRLELAVNIVLLFSLPLITPILIWIALDKVETDLAFQLTYSGGMICLFAFALLGFANIYRYTGIIDGGRETFRPLVCLYFSIITWTSVGYGDVQPIGLARLIACVEAVYAHIWMIVFIGLFASIFLKKEASLKKDI